MNSADGAMYRPAGGEAPGMIDDGALHPVKFERESKPADQAETYYRQEGGADHGEGGYAAQPGGAPVAQEKSCAAA